MTEGSEVPISITDIEKKPTKPSFEQRVNDLIKPTEETPALVTDERLVRLANLLLLPQNQSKQGLQALVDKGNELYLNEGSQEFEQQLMVLGKVMADRYQELSPKRRKKELVALVLKKSEEKSYEDKLLELQERVAKASEEQASNQKQMAGKEVEQLPKDKKERRERVITMIEKIESNDSPLSRSENSLVASNLERMMDQMDPELARETRARLRLHDCYTTISAIAGTTKDMVGDLRKASTELRARNRLLEPEDFNTLFKEDLNGLKISQAFTFLQGAALNGVVLIKGQETTTLRYMGKDQSAQENDTLREVLEKALGDDKNAKKSLQIASRLATATFETSVWDKDNISDGLAECIHFKKYRTGRWGQARDRGPDITIAKIEGFGTSYLRQASLARKKIEIDADGIKTKTTVPLVPNVKEEDLEGFSNIDDLPEKKRIKGILKRRGFFPSPEKDKDWQSALRVQEYNYLELKRGDYGGYLSNILPRYLNTKEYLLQTSWKPEDFTTDKIESYMAPFKTTDPDDSLKLSAWFALGALDSSLKEGVLLGWGGFELAKVMVNLTKVVRFVNEEDRDENGRAKVMNLSFLTSEKAKWVEKELHIYLRIASLEAQRSFVGIVRTKT